MNCQEFSDGFDLLFNNISSNQAPGLNEWEKSVFLTKAQSQLVKEYFNNRIDSVGGGFDGSQKRQYDFSGLIRTEKLFNINTFVNRIDESEKLDRRSLVFLMPWNYFLSVNEILSDDRWQYSVMAIDYAEYQRLMLKPYNLPVKRGAWRLNTDKKNCNFWREFVDTADGDTVRKSETDYMFISTWADEKRNLEVNIKFEYVNADNPIIAEYASSAPGCYRDGKTFIFDYNNNRCRIDVDAGWGDTKLTYEIEITVYYVTKLDDEEVIDAIKKACNIEYTLTQFTGEGDFDKMCKHTDGFMLASAPSKFNAFSGEHGKTFTTKVIQLPFVEIIGKFVGKVNYKMRFVRTLKPIILEDLDNYGDDLTLEGETQKTECELPVECHEEILERAVTLAKIAWQGGTMTQAQAAQQEDRRK